MGFRVCCVGPSGSPPTLSTPIPPPPILTPQPKDIPALPNYTSDNSSLKPQPPQAPRQGSATHPTGATPDTVPIDLPSREGNISVRRISSFASPTFEMVSGRTPLGAWHSVAAKVVAANRFRGIGGESPVQEFKIEELGDQNGKLVFGPVAVFNGQS